MRSIKSIAAGLLLCLCGSANAAPMQMVPLGSPYIQRVAGHAVTVDISADRALPATIYLTLGDILTFVRPGAVVRTTLIPPQGTNRYGAPPFQLIARERTAADTLFAEYSANMLGTFIFTVNRAGAAQQFVVIVRRY